MSADEVWVMVIAMGVYQGVNPAMGWLLAVGSGLQRRSHYAVLETSWEVAFGHFLSMLVVLLPVAIILGAWGTPQRLAAVFWMLNVGMLLFGCYKLLHPRHPRFISRIRPDRPIRWSFWMGLTHCGSPLMMTAVLVDLIAMKMQMREMMVPAMESETLSLWQTIGHNIILSLMVSGLMIVPLLILASSIAFLVFEKLGLRALTTYWFNFETVWSLSFIGMAMMGFVMGA